MAEHISLGCHGVSQQIAYTLINQWLLFLWTYILVSLFLREQCHRKDIKLWMKKTPTCHPIHLFNQTQKVNGPFVGISSQQSSVLETLLPFVGISSQQSSVLETLLNYQKQWNLTNQNSQGVNMLFRGWTCFSGGEHAFFTFPFFFVPKQIAV